MTKSAIAFIGPMLGGHPGWTPNPAETLATKIESVVDVTLVSDKINPYLRVLNIVFHLFRSRKSLDCAVVLVYSGRGFRVAEISSKIANANGTPVVLWLHGGNLPSLARTSPHRVRALLHNAASCIAPSQFLKRSLGHLGVPIGVIPNLLDLDLTSYQSRGKLRPEILWLRKFEDIYQPLLAVEAFCQVRRRHPTARMTMAGQDRGMLQATLQCAEELGCRDAIEFPGFVSGAEKNLAFANHDIFLHTNSVDNAPVALVEAAAHGLPIVAADVGGIADLVEDDVSALLFPPTNSHAAATSVLRLLSEDALSAQLSSKALEIAKAATWGKVAPQWRNVFSKAIGSEIPPLIEPH